MTPFPNLHFKISDVLKIAGVGLLAIIVLVIVIRLVGSSVQSIVPRGPITSSAGMDSSYAYQAAAIPSYNGAMPELSARNIAPMPPGSVGGSVGNDAENFEVTTYQGTIETRNLDETCAKIADLKSGPYVVFENANKSEHSCNYTFKVIQKELDTVLARIKELDPKDLSENIHTVKRTLDDFTSETEILQKKKQSIDETLEGAIKAYDEITALATRTQDAESLAKIIDSKIQIIERLTQERININEQLDRLSRAKAEQLDRVDYTYFTLNVYENTYLDGENITDSWKAALKEFVQDVNQIAQDITIRLVALVLFAVQYILYFFILLVMAKYVWQFAKYVWKK